MIIKKKDSAEDKLYKIAQILNQKEQLKYEFGDFVLRNGAEEKIIKIKKVLKEN